MAGLGGRGAAGAVLALVMASAAGCGNGSQNSPTPAEQAASAASAAASLASRGGDALASASAEAGRRLDEAKGGLNAKDQVSLGAVTLDGDGRATTTVTARNTASAAKSFAVQVNFTDGGGNLLDVVVLMVKNVAAHGSGHGTARGNRRLHGEVRANVGTALRY
ncbi:MULTISPECIES: hypothetical protein [Actinomycetes]|uniref:Lipoprotein n=3 Tax=Actinomycetes TaxID=1760 RepID=A0ABP8T578_9ACTN|nr:MULTISPECIES: hypothetical protein [unclassified Streptomyces]MYR02891.1 hypothetical protein [Streptomyces sp. SID6139]MYR17611.1 hypothetical protein [Streptomyces sp. SID6137]TGZ19548.1 hypothetical protein DV517_45220 [Streptomyces sp. S816]